MTMNAPEMPLVHMENIGRTFGNIVALEGVNFDVGYQEVVGLLGDNGAGKSTLIKVLTGIHPPTSGQIYFEGRLVNIDSPQAARELGIETVYQDLALVPLMSIDRNFYLGREPTRRIGPMEILDQATMRARTTEALAHIGIQVRNAGEPVGTLSGGERQSIAIGRAVHFGTKLHILDEPTSALSIGETRKVLNYTLEAKRRGLSVIFITHNIYHVFEVADRFSIISHGHKVGDFHKEDVTIDEVSGMIMGEPVPERFRNAPPLKIPTRPVVINTGLAGVSGNGASAGSNGATSASGESFQQRTARRRRNRSILLAIFAIFVAVVLGLTYYYSLPKAESTDLVPPLVKTVYGTNFAAAYPEGWLVERSEANIIQLSNSQKDWQIVFNWTASRTRGVSPSKPLAEIAKQVQEDDLTPRKFTTNADFKVGEHPGYRFEWENADTGRSGVEYIFFDDTNNFYEVNFQSKAADVDKLRPLADAIMTQLKFVSR